MKVGSICWRLFLEAGQNQRFKLLLILFQVIEKGLPTLNLSVCVRLVCVMVWNGLWVGVATCEYTWTAQREAQGERIDVLVEIPFLFGVDRWESFGRHKIIGASSFSCFAGINFFLIFSNPKVSDLCPEGSCQQYIARSEVQMVYAKGVDVPMQHTDRQLQYRAMFTDTLRTKHKDLAN